MTKRAKWITVLIVVLSFISLVYLFLFGQIKAEWFSEDYHIEQVNKRLVPKVSDWKYANGEKYESYTVHPLYDENDELKYFLVEFEPYGFVFVKIGNIAFLRMITSMSNSMYMLNTVNSLKDEDEYTWSPYIRDETYSQPMPYKDRKWILDANGDRIYYKKSPYFVTNNFNERKYLIEIDGGGYVCAVKKDDKFLNLISQKTFSIYDEDLAYKEHIYISFLVKIKHYDL